MWIKEDEICSICNKYKLENMYQFYIECPIYQSLIVAYVNKYIATQQELRIYMTCLRIYTQKRLIQ